MTKGTETMFADLGHFSVKSIQISMCSVVFPSLVLAYTGQAAYLRKHTNNVQHTFYNSISGSLYWHMFAVIVMAAIIASQAMISGTFSIIQQSLALSCLPRVKIFHTSNKYEGQVYIPEFNYLLMLACVGVTSSMEDARRLIVLAWIDLVQGIPCKSNLISFNPHRGSAFKPTIDDKMIEFRNVLAKAGCVVLLRPSRGDDQMAACGQLGTPGEVQPPRLRVPARFQKVIVEMTNVGVDRSIECTGSLTAMISAFECVHDGWGVAVLVGVPNKDDIFKNHPMNLLNERTLKGTFFGNYKPRSGISDVVEKYMNKEQC